MNITGRNFLIHRSNRNKRCGKGDTKEHKNNRQIRIASDGKISKTENETTLITILSYPHRPQPVLLQKHVP